MRTDKELLNITRKKLREAKKQLEQNKLEDKERVRLIKNMFNRLKELGEYNEETILINGIIFNFR